MAKRLIFIALSLLLSTCSVQDPTKFYINVHMLGVLKSPAGTTAPTTNTAAKTYVEPLSQTFTLQNIVLFTQSGAKVSAVNLYAGQAAQTVTVSNQSQLLFTTLGSSSLNQARVVKFAVIFADSITGVSRYKASSSLTLKGVSSCTPSALVSGSVKNVQNSCSVEYNQAFTIVPGQNYDFYVEVQWKETVLRTTAGGTYTEKMQPPSLSLSLNSL